MARQTWDQLAALYPDNTAGAISAEDLRVGMIDSERPHEASENPDTSDDETSGFDVGHKWLNTSDGSIWECRNASTGSADWVKVYPQGALADAALPKLATVNSYAGNRTLDASDSGAYVRITAAGAVTLPDDLSEGFQCVIVNATDGDTVALSAATTLTLPSGFDAEVQNRRAVTLIHVGSNVWEAHGALVESS